MTDDELDAIVERANDPSLIPGIYNWCDRRCERCAFTARCFQFRLSRAGGDEIGRASRHDTLPAQIGGVFDRTIELVRAIGRRMRLDSAELDRAMEAGPPGDMANRLDAAGEDPLVALACRYAADVHPIVRVLAPVVALRGDQASIDAVDDIAWYATLVSTKIYRAVLASLEYAHDVRAHKVRHDDGHVIDMRGSAKCARLFIASSIRAWQVLMEVGRATADGVPARLVQVLTDLDRALAARFPDAMSFARPGFDDVAAWPVAMTGTMTGTETGTERGTERGTEARGATPPAREAEMPPARPVETQALAEVKIEQ